VKTRSLAVAAPGERLPGGFARFFPDEADASAALAPADVASLTDGASAVYAAATEGTAAALSRRLGVAPAAARVLARDPIVLITHIFLDRLLRLKRLVDRDGREALSAPRGALEAPVLWTSLVQAANTSREFNEALLGRVAEVWTLGFAAGTAAPAAPASAGVGNLNFAAPGILRRIAWKTARVTSRLAGRIPTLGLAYAESCFLDAGLIGPFRMADLHGPQDPDAPPADAGLRREVVLDGCAAAKPALDALLASWGFDAAERAASVRAHAELCAELFPRARLEGLLPRLRLAERSLARYAKHPLVLSAMGDDRTACMLAAARTLGLPVVGMQHGAHYGFVDAPCHIELEYAHLDRFITWGWSRTPDHPLSRGVEAIPLPSPWLSERARRWRRELPAPSAGREWDVLLMTERLARYPATLTTVRLNRLDALGTLDSELTGLVTALAARGLRVLHKPFNAASAEAQSEAIAALRASNGGAYATHDRLDKGLSAKLLASAGMVVWDEPGGGIFECLVSGIPALLLWTPARYALSPRAAAPFEALRDAGVLHASPESLAEAAAALSAGPSAWLRDPKRASLIAGACRELAWADDAWAKPWRGFLDSL
jgi:hypothetical protein